jgi:response regulator RpfG family c-di-GMP phosphodiesterase
VLNRKVPSSDIEKKTVMICDDDQDLRQLFGQALKSRYNIILVSSGEDCIGRLIQEKNRGNKIHLLLLDYRLGDMSGDYVARKVKEMNGTKIILISAFDLGDELVKELHEKNYIANYVAKPVHLINLIETVTSTIC